MSHAKNVESYSRLVDICTGYGGTYNPGRQTLQLKAMRALLKEAQSSLQHVSLKRNALSIATDDREQEFKALHQLVSRIIGTMKASQVPSGRLAHAYYYSRLINGYREGKERLPVPSEDSEDESLTTRSVNQMSFVARAHNFLRFAQLVMELPSYQTHSNDLQPSALLEKAEELKGLNENWSKAKVALSNARIHRNKVLYQGVDAVLSNATAVKSYVRVEFGNRSQESVQLKEVSFTKPRIR
ncbi:hypothetical protein MASR2M41_04020 [Flammeovirgaceae bacterium]